MRVAFTAGGRERLQLIFVAELPRHVVPFVVGNVPTLDFIGPIIREEKAAGTKICRCLR